MDLTEHALDLETKGYTIVRGILSPEKVDHVRTLFYEWIHSVPQVRSYHEDSFQGLMKYGQIGHQKHAWAIRTDPVVQQVFRALWNTEELVSGFDGTCWMPKHWDRPDVHWIHTDQAACAKGLHCIQGFVSLTDNQTRSFVVYERSHLLHEHYMETYGHTGKNNWCIIRPEYLEGRTPKVLPVNAGDLVLWDSRTFHQNQFGDPEERLVQYVCFLPRHHPGNTPGQQSLRRNYCRKRRTTAHWPYPLSANPFHPDDPLIVPWTDLSEYEEGIRALL